MLVKVNVRTYKQENMKEPMLKTSKKTKVVVIDKKSTRALTLDEIEEQLDELAQKDCSSLVEAALIESKMKRLEMSANHKFKVLQAKALIQSAEPVEVQPLEVKFISAKTDEQKARLERIDSEILANRVGNRNA